MQRVVTGLALLLLVDVMWVATPEVTKYFSYSPNLNNKPYFNTFVKSSLCAIYLMGFLIYRSWWYQCRGGNGNSSSPPYSPKCEEASIDCDKLISDPVFVPIKIEGSKSCSSGSSTETEDISDGSVSSRSVRFSKILEVRQLSSVHAEEAVLARLSYTAYMRAMEARLKAASKLSVRQIVKIALVCSFILFFGHLSYHIATSYVQTGLPNILLSLSALFTLVLASVFPATTGDRFTLSKFVAVALSIGGIVLVTWSTKDFHLDREPLSAIWSVLGALLLALFLVLLRRRVDNEDKLNMPMFYGFLGLCVLLLLWPGLVILHLTKIEELVWPNTFEWSLLVIDGFVSVVLSNLLWLWGCFLTSSLAATLSLTLTIPMSAIAEVLLSQETYDWRFYVGMVPVFIAFFGVTMMSYYDNCDPVLMAINKAFRCSLLSRRRYFSRNRDTDREQTESLIGVGPDRMET